MSNPGMKRPVHQPGPPAPASIPRPVLQPLPAPQKPQEVQRSRHLNHGQHQVWVPHEPSSNPDRLAPAASRTQQQQPPQQQPQRTSAGVSAPQHGDGGGATSSMLAPERSAGKGHSQLFAFDSSRAEASQSRDRQREGPAEYALHPRQGVAIQNGESGSLPVRISGDDGLLVGVQIPQPQPQGPTHPCKGAGGASEARRPDPPAPDRPVDATTARNRSGLPDAAATQTAVTPPPTGLSDQQGSKQQPPLPRKLQGSAAPGPRPHQDSRSYSDFKSRAGRGGWSGGGGRGESSRAPFSGGRGRGRGRTNHQRPPSRSPSVFQDGRHGVRGNAGNSSRSDGKPAVQPGGVKGGEKSGNTSAGPASAEGHLAPGATPAGLAASGAMDAPAAALDATAAESGGHSDGNGVTAASTEASHDALHAQSGDVSVATSAVGGAAAAAAAATTATAAVVAAVATSAAMATTTAAASAPEAATHDGPNPADTAATHASAPAAPNPTSIEEASSSQHGSEVDSGSGSGSNTISISGGTGHSATGEGTRRPERRRLFALGGTPTPDAGDAASKGDVVDDHGAGDAASGASSVASSAAGLVGLASRHEWRPAPVRLDQSPRRLRELPVILQLPPKQGSKAVKEPHAPAAPSKQDQHDMVWQAALAWSNWCLPCQATVIGWDRGVYIVHLDIPSLMSLLLRGACHMKPEDLEWLPQLDRSIVRLAPLHRKLFTAETEARLREAILEEHRAWPVQGAEGVAEQGVDAGQCEEGQQLEEPRELGQEGVEGVAAVEDDRVAAALKTLSDALAASAKLVQAASLRTVVNDVERDGETGPALTEEVGAVAAEEVGAVAAAGSAVCGSPAGTTTAVDTRQWTVGRDVPVSQGGNDSSSGSGGGDGAAQGSSGSSSGDGAGVKVAEGDSGSRTGSGSGAEVDEESSDSGGGESLAAEADTGWKEMFNTGSGMFSDARAVPVTMVPASVKGDVSDLHVCVNLQELDQPLSSLVTSRKLAKRAAEVLASHLEQLVTCEVLQPLAGGVLAKFEVEVEVEAFAGVGGDAAGQGIGKEEAAGEGGEAADLLSEEHVSRASQVGEARAQSEHLGDGRTEEGCVEGERSGADQPSTVALAGIGATSGLPGMTGQDLSPVTVADAANGAAATVPATGDALAGEASGVTISAAVGLAADAAATSPPESHTASSECLAPSASSSRGAQGAPSSGLVRLPVLAFLPARRFKGALLEKGGGKQLCKAVRKGDLVQAHLRSFRYDRVGSTDVLMLAQLEMRGGPQPDSRKIKLKAKGRKGKGKPGVTTGVEDTVVLAEAGHVPGPDEI